MAHERRQYTREFKVEAVRLVVEEERPLARVARDVQFEHGDELARRCRVSERSRNPATDPTIHPAASNRARSASSTFASHDSVMLPQAPHAGVDHRLRRLLPRLLDHFRDDDRVRIIFTRGAATPGVRPPGSWLQAMSHPTWRQHLPACRCLPKSLQATRGRACFRPP
jgi:transposase-like protein